MTEPLFTRRHFVTLAQWLAERDALEEEAEWLARKLATTNPNFDRSRFLAAARGEPQSRRDKP